MLSKIKVFVSQWWSENPLAVILFAGLFFRLLAAIFSKGFGMMDDHFLVIEVAQSWVDKTDYNSWLPKDGQSIPTPSGHSFFYPGLHYLLFKFLEFFGLKNPQGKMYVVRFLHALYSMITIYCGYKISMKIAGEKIAKQVGLLLALFWFFPFVSVRNLVESACIPPLMLATLLALKYDKPKIVIYLLIGLLLGIGFNIRFQTILFTGGFGLALLFQRKIIQAILVGIGFTICAVAFQGLCDLIIWHHPFVEFGEYVRYNLANSRTYFDQPWYNYILLLMGILIPPISLILLFGFFRSFKKHLLLFLPSFIFLVLHSYFPNKQERFILPIIPLVIILGTIGWSEFSEQSKFWIKRKKILQTVWIFFWVLNTILLCVISVSYSKKNRVEAMCYLAQKNDVQALIIDDSNRDDFQLSPRFYLRKWVPEIGISNSTNKDEQCNNIFKVKKDKQPNYIIFYQSENLDQRKAEYEKHFNLSYETTIQPSFIDNVMYKLNPNNVNCVTYIYKIKSSKCGN